MKNPAKLVDIPILSEHPHQISHPLAVAPIYKVPHLPSPQQVSATQHHEPHAQNRWTGIFSTSNLQLLKLNSQPPSGLVF
ncbi:hypothetical protein [Comamonas thiooxydans]|uniref:hypothetical protein n=1 Tax=Comamonas thiooxydans TaxID=363952 RepID=UPI000F4EEF8B|nr:hypothetical protein [Comamonas thiooxydans]MDO1472684.1 hypothetical protein [Comamonas thiooxydans]